MTSTNKLDQLGLDYEIVREWIQDYENEGNEFDSDSFYPISKFITNYPSELEGSEVKIFLGKDIDEVTEIR